MDLSFDGLSVESHCNPDCAWSDASQQITPDVLDYVLNLLVIRDSNQTTENLAELRRQIDGIDEQLLELLAKRMRISREIGVYKKEHNMPILQSPRYSEILEKHNISARMLEIELTETAVVSEYDRVKRLLSSFQSDGMQTSLDDFGAGGSLLNNMVDIPVNTIKLDKLFLTRCSSNARGTDFLREIVHLVKRLGYNVICEGIETEEQVQLLRSLDCDGAQGFWFSKAIPAEEFERRYLCS